MNAMWVVESGLEVGEQVIIEGLQKVRPGVEVDPIVKAIEPITGTITELSNECTADMFSRIFMQRPQFAFVISIVITLGGLISMGGLPINLYPEITPPQVTANYPGASAQVVEESVLRLIESGPQICGVFFCISATELFISVSRTLMSISEKRLIYRHETDTEPVESSSE